MSSLSLGSPIMSDKTLLLSVEDLIGIAMGSADGNIVDFKLIQTILHILARQMRLLEQKVVLVAGDLPVLKPPALEGRGRSRGRKGREDEDSLRKGRTPSELKMEEQREGRRRRSSDEGESGSQDIDDDGRGSRGRSRGERGGRDDDDERESRGGSGARGRKGRDAEERRGHEKGGRRSSDEEESGESREHDGRGGRGRSGGRGGRDEDDERGSRGTSGGRGREGRDVEKKTGHRPGGRGGSDEGESGSQDDEGRGSRGRSRGERGGRDEDDDRGSRDRSGGRGGEGRDDDERGSHGRGRRGDEGGRSTGRDEEGRGARDKSGGGGRGGRDTVGRGERGRGRRDDERGREGIEVREVDGPGHEKLLVVEKGSTTAGSDRDRRDSIAVVTQSQFRFLVDAVEELQKAAGPLPALTMPDNKQLRKDLAAGASLTDTMQAMQVAARVKAAEQAIAKLGGLLTQLAASGVLPSGLADAAMALSEDEHGMRKTSGELAGGLAAGGFADGGFADGGFVAGGAAAGQSGPASVMTKDSVGARHVTETEMGKALTDLRDEISRELRSQVDSAAAAAQLAEKTAKTVGGKVEELLKMDSRIMQMYTMVEDYAQQLNGFDAGLNTQMQSFKEQMTTMRADLKGGMAQFEAANDNAETAAVMELNERFEGLVRGLEDTLLQHSALTNMQNTLTLDLKSLVESVEMLREQKADRDEMLDGLRDKADKWQLEGLVKQEEFDKAHADLQQRVDQCHEKFARQDEVWQEVMKDLTDLANTKAQVTDLLKLRDEATAQVREIDEKINQLALILGEPKAAVLMRKLARDAVCGACLAPALMELGAAPEPPLLPAARGAPAEPCPPGYPLPTQPDPRTHKCHRWVGGSHTLLPAGRVHAEPLPVSPEATNKFAGYGDDGRLYYMETEMEPCVECNVVTTPAPPATARTDAGAGDGAEYTGPVCECPPDCERADL